MLRRLIKRNSRNMTPRRRRPSLNVEGHHFFEPPKDKLSLAALAQPHDLESLLTSQLYDPELPKSLKGLLDDMTNRCGTPEMPNCPRDPGRPSNYYRVCLVTATLLGRAFALVNGPNVSTSTASEALSHAARLPVELRDQIHAEHLKRLAQRERLWKVIEDIFGKAYFSPHCEPEPGARYAAGVVLLTAGEGLRTWPYLDGHGKHWIPWMCHFAKDEGREERWTMSEVLRLVEETEKWPRDRTDGFDCWRKLDAWELTDEDEALGRKSVFDVLDSFWHYPQELLDLYDVVRVHLKEQRRDLTSKEVMELFHGGLDEMQNETAGGYESYDSDGNVVERRAYDPQR